MRTYLLLVLVMVVALLQVDNARAHDGKPACEGAATKQRSLEEARAELKKKPKSVSLRANLADELLGIGCYDEAAHVLEDGVKLNPADRNLQARLNAARSFIGEREYMEKQPAITDGNDVALLRAQLRCKQIGDGQACDQALAMNPNDAAVWVAKGDALLKEKRSREALHAFNRANQVSAQFPQTPKVDVASRISAAQGLLAEQSPPVIAQTSKASTIAAQPVRQASRTYSNVEPVSRSN